MLKIAIPMAEGRLCMHFGHCEEFAFVEVDETSKTIIKTETQIPPPHEPGVIPRWIASNGANLVIVGGMGPKAQEILHVMNVAVISGAPVDTPENLVKAFLSKTLACGINVCDHESGQPHDHHCSH